MQNYSTHKSESGFTLIEMMVAIAIIGILASVGIPKYNDYRIRGYDAHSKQALHDIYKLCNAYWIDTNPLEACDLSKIKNTYYGFTQDPDVTNTLAPLPREKFCATAKHKDSTSTYSIDSAALISPGNTCSVVESPVKEASLSTPPIDDDPPETTGAENLIEDLLAAELAKKEERMADEKAAVELKAAIEKATREDCCVEVQWKTAEQAAEYDRRIKASKCPYQTSEIREACRVYFNDAYMANRRDPSIPNCPEIRYRWHSRNRIDNLSTAVVNGVTVPAEGIHASQFDIDNPDSECARKF